MPTTKSPYQQNLEAGQFRSQVLTGRIKALNGGTTVLDCAVNAAVLTPAAPNSTSVVIGTSTAQATFTGNATSVRIEDASANVLFTFPVGTGEVFETFPLVSGDFYYFQNMTYNL